MLLEYHLGHLKVSSLDESFVRLKSAYYHLLRQSLLPLQEVEKLRQDKLEIDQQLRSMHGSSMGSMPSFPPQRRSDRYLLCGHHYYHFGDSVCTFSNRESRAVLSIGDAGHYLVWWTCLSLIFKYFFEKWNWYEGLRVWHEVYFWIMLLESLCLRFSFSCVIPFFNLFVLHNFMPSHFLANAL